MKIWVHFTLQYLQSAPYLTILLFFVQISVEMDVVNKPDLTAALKEIRMQYEVLSTRNQQTAEDWYQTKITNVSQEAARNNDNMRQAKEEINEYRRQLQARTLEIDALRSANESLERQLQETEDRNNEEIAQMQVTSVFSYPAICLFFSKTGTIVKWNKFIPWSRVLTHSNTFIFIKKI